jgi:hypothetical protein
MKLKSTFLVLCLMVAVSTLASPADTTTNASAIASQNITEHKGGGGDGGGGGGGHPDDSDGGARPGGGAGGGSAVSDGMSLRDSNALLGLVALFFGAIAV